MGGGCLRQAGGLSVFEDGVPELLSALILYMGFGTRASALFGYKTGRETSSYRSGV